MDYSLNVSDTAKNETLMNISRWLRPMQEIFLSHGYKHTYIGGSSARDLLDHVLFGRSLDLRDLDIYLIRGQTVQTQDVAILANEIENEGLAFLGSEKLRPKLRANPAFPKPACYAYEAGLGAHMFAVGMPILSLGVFHTNDDLKLNGLFDIDNIFLCLENEVSLAQYAQRVWSRRDDLNLLYNHGLVLDRLGGYTSWIYKSPHLVNWIEVERCFARHSLRIVRSFAKSKQLNLTDDFVEEFRSHDPHDAVVDNSREFYRSLIKIFGDRWWAHELSMLSKLGALKYVSETLDAYIRSHTPEELQNLVHEADEAEQDQITTACNRVTVIFEKSQDAHCTALLPQLLSLASTAFGAAA